MGSVLGAQSARRCVAQSGLVIAFVRMLAFGPFATNGGLLLGFVRSTTQSPPQASQRKSSRVALVGEAFDNVRNRPVPPHRGHRLRSASSTVPAALRSFVVGSVRVGR